MNEQQQLNAVIDHTIFWLNGLEEATPDPPISAGEYIAVAEAFDNTPIPEAHVRKIAVLAEAVSNL